MAYMAKLYSLPHYEKEQEEDKEEDEEADEEEAKEEENPQDSQGLPLTPSYLPLLPPLSSAQGCTLVSCAGRRCTPVVVVVASSSSLTSPNQLHFQTSYNTDSEPVCRAKLTAQVFGTDN